MTDAGPRIVVMGVSATGKSSVARALARLLDARYIDADDLHPAANVAKMAAGTPLDDDDRWPWLDLVGEALMEADRAVVACSALRRSYRDRLRAAAPGILFVHLTGSAELLASRAESRVGHFMPPALLRSQLDALEPLEGDERGIAIDIAAPVETIAHTAFEWLGAHAL